MFEKIKYKAIVFSSVFFVLCFAYNVSATPITTSASVVTAVTVTEVTALNFGLFVTDTTLQTITFEPGGTISGSGAIVLVGGDVMGVASTSGPSLNDTVVVNVLGTVLTGPGLDMPLEGICQGPGGALGTYNGSCNFVSGGGTENVQIGGRLTVNPNQTGGLYTGTLAVVAGYY